MNTKMSANKILILPLQNKKGDLFGRPRDTFRVLFKLYHAFRQITVHIGTFFLSPANYFPNRIQVGEDVPNLGSTKAIFLLADAPTGPWPRTGNIRIRHRVRFPR